MNIKIKNKLILLLVNLLSKYFTIKKFYHKIFYHFIMFFLFPIRTIKHYKLWKQFQKLISYKNDIVFLTKKNIDVISYFEKECMTQFYNNYEIEQYYNLYLERKSFIIYNIKNNLINKFKNSINLLQEKSKIILIN